MSWGSFLKKLNHLAVIILTYLSFEVTKTSVLYTTAALVMIPAATCISIITSIFS